MTIREHRLAQRLARDVDALKQVLPCFAQEDDRLGRLELSVEQSLFPSVAPPPAKQLERGA